MKYGLPEDKFKTKIEASLEKISKLITKRNILSPDNKIWPFSIG